MNARATRRPRVKGKPASKPKFRSGGGGKTGGTDKPWWKLCGFVLIYLPLGLAVAGFLTAEAFFLARRT
jgi:hypothetical protein